MPDTITSTRVFFGQSERQNGLDDASLFANNLNEGVNVIFTGLKSIRDNLNAQKQWSSTLGIPDAFWSETSVRHNGYFGSSTFPYNKNKTLTRYDTMFRFIIKRLKPEIKGKVKPQIRENVKPQIKEKNYYWNEMGFFTRWTDKGNLLVCFDTPEDFPQQFVAILQARQHDAGETARKPYALHVILMDFLIPTYDQSIWDMSKKVRDIEEHRGFQREEGYPGLHEVARHTAHATETVQVAASVIERMASECEALAERQSDDDAEQAMFERLESLRMHHSMILGVAARSISNEKRLSNEINLIFNMIAQKDNKLNIGIANATRVDSVAMKTIAIVTLTFLPATYVSAILGMNLFSYNPDTHGGHITYSPDLWLYFVVSIPLTAAVLTIYWAWQKREERTENLESVIEKGAKSAGTGTSSPGSK
ncbi:hypothetical protein KCU65_g3769, partial [Aureobasidium melanogenum]